ncbi:hypothetical protein [Mycolicibacterium neworleansense]|uniref:Uncharacterized protein n=1 Tax=Mycolicibacterium neworleansense TaxID=146018 RepID=A0A0H5S1C9_9MYCO|nr:hypothetical protein [Mycolicibacterium neworleansense]MCV7363850.1 hypothetical protein [Mycolicibacterium neworleansense]CRZ14809.1 hypothetical protein BN2156_01665 [Mycolicibacterium neworleansense]
MRAQLKVELVDRYGTVLQTRQAHNTVLRTGGQLIAELFTGAGAPITHMAVGTSDADPTAVTVAALGNDDGTGQPGITGDTVAAIPAEAFTTSVDETRSRVLVKVRATLPNAAGVGTLREAALMSRRAGGDVLYNRVVFTPVTKAADHDLTLFWEVEFPFGDLQWLAR